jgi:hypothetical protein
MAFTDDIPGDEPTLVNIDDKTLPGRAVFTDSSTLVFPDGVTFPPDNHVDPGSRKVIQQRVLCTPAINPATGKPKSPPVLLLLHATKSYVAAVIDRLTKGV